MKKLSGGCTLDCFDACRFNVYVEDNKAVKIEGDKNHPYTKGFICRKGLDHLERQNHPQRQYKPLLKIDGKWHEISFDEAVNIMAEKLGTCREKYGSQSVLYYEQYGSGSLLKSIGDIFFNFYGGCSKQKGGPCWSAGMAAQKKNFGDARSHSLEDMINSRTIIVWGKNPANTTIHTMQMIKKAQKNGSFVIVIDPIKTDTAKMADLYVQIKPGGDAALALALGKIIIEKNKIDSEYIKNHVNGFKEYKSYLESLNLHDLCERAGITEETADFIVEKYTEHYSSILLGYGLQKYAHGGNTILLIDALTAITGQIGKSGGGVNYANKVYPSVLNTDPYDSESYADNREFYVSRMSSFIEENNIKMAVIVKSNLLSQLADLNSLEKALKSIDFKVCFDQFLTDTAEACDLFIPSTTVLESEDILYSSMTNPYLTYIEKAVEPEEELMDEYFFFKELAQNMAIKNYPLVSKREYLSKVIEPLKKIEPKMSLEYIKQNYFTIHESIAWKNQKFMTPSGKFEICFNKDVLNKAVHKENDTLDYKKTNNRAGCKITDNKSDYRKVNNENGYESEGNPHPGINDMNYRFRILTTHGRESLSSQGYMDNEDRSECYINKKMAEIYGFADGEDIYLESSKGIIETCLRIDDGIGDDIVMMYSGWWKKHGSPNWITESGISDIGGQVTYNETLVRLKKVSSGNLKGFRNL